MSELLQAIRETDERPRPGGDTAYRRRPNRVAVFLAGIASVVAIGVGVSVDGSGDTPRSTDRPPAPFVTIEGASATGSSSADG